MDENFWRQRWEAKEIGFHGSSAHPMLQRHVDRLGLAPGSRVFLPLCGKTLDIGWLLSRGYRVAGAELIEIAVKELFEELGVTPRIDRAGSLARYQADRIDLFAGDIFALTTEQLGHVDATYDRAALVALPGEMRDRYAAHLMALTAAAPQLLIEFDYDQSAMPGPPFSIGDDEVRRHYGEAYALELLASEEVAGGLKGQCAALEKAWLLSPRGGVNPVGGTTLD